MSKAGSTPHSWHVTVRTYDAASNKLSETAVQCTARHPGEACPPAYVVARQDLSPEILRKIAGVAFLVRPNKETKK